MMPKNPLHINGSLEVSLASGDDPVRELVERQLHRPSAMYMDALDMTIFSGARGLEISGPSEIFTNRGFINLYSTLLSVDCFSHPRPPEWGGRILGDSYSYSPYLPEGRQFVGDATRLIEIVDESYDVILASHVLEHIANPLKALFEWRRVLRRKGMLVVVLPHFEATFDRRRSITPLEHILHDYSTNTAESDETHFDDVIRNSSKVLTEDWCKANILHRGLHHHVFDTNLAIRVVAAADFEIVWVDHCLPHHILLVAEKPPEGHAYLGDPVAHWKPVLTRSPFVSDSL